MQLQLHKWYLSSGIGMTFQRLDWSDWEGESRIVEKLSKFVFDHEKYVSRGMGLLLTGDFGTGKTMLSTMTLKEYVKLGYSCYSTTFASMVELFTAGWYDEDAKKYFAKKIMQSEVLLLDDLGRELKTKNKLSESTFDDVLRNRVEAGRPTFITTNLDPHTELVSGYGGAILSLLKEKSVHFPFQGEDYRLKANQRELSEIDRGEVRPIV
jgi:DNA replication protein DnaC